MLDTLENLMVEVNNCTKCHSDVEGPPVFGSGNFGSGLLFVGEAPGGAEIQYGIPFVGTAGELLTNTLVEAGIDRFKDIYVTNVLRCRPTGTSPFGNIINRTPNQIEINNCSGYLDRLVKLMQPRLIVCVGAVAARTIISPDFSITRQRGKFLNSRFCRDNNENIPAFAILHPSFIIRKHGTQRQLLEQQLLLDLAKVRDKYQ